jgi:hypothetical protein
MIKDPPEDEVPAPPEERPTELGRRRFLGNAAAAAAAVVGVPALLAACDSGGGTEAQPDGQAHTPTSGPALATGIGASPWFVVHEKLAATIGAASNVSVPALERTGTYTYLQRIVTDDDRVGTGLATVIRSSHRFTDSSGASVTLTVYVYTSSGKRHSPRTIYKQSDLAYAMKDALASNALADGVLRDSLSTGRPIVAIFKSSVVKFQASVASDYYGNFLQVASRSASDIFNVSVAGYPITATTRDLKQC